MIVPEWEHKHGCVLRDQIARDIEVMLTRGEGVTKESAPHRHRRFPLRRLIFRKLRDTAHLTRELHAAITDKIYDPHRTDKMRFFSGTTARIEVH